MNGLTVATWNAEWRVPGSEDAALIRDRLDQVGADIICLTEAYANIMGSGGHLIESEPDYGYPLVEGRRKVVLWSREPWEQVDRVGHAELPPGRFVAGRTMTAARMVDVIGVCVLIFEQGRTRMRWVTIIAAIALSGWLRRVEIVWS